MENLELYNHVREVPKDAQKPITAGRLKGFTDINPMWRIKCLTEQFGPCGIGWYYKTVDKWTETINDETCAFVMIELYVFYESKWSQPISGTGGSKLATKERSGIYVSDECYKMATTDALSVACKNLGIGADIYWKESKTKYDCSSTSEDLSGKETEPSKEAEMISSETTMSIKNIIDKYPGAKLADQIKARFKVNDIKSLTKEKGQKCLKMLIYYDKQHTEKEQQHE